METTQRIRVLLVDDHFFVRMGLADSLSDEPTIEVIGQANSGREAIIQYVRLLPDVMVLDLRLGDMDGDEVLSSLTGQGVTSIRCVMLSINEGEEDIHRCVQAGASAYLPKSTERSELIVAIKAVAAGEKYYPHRIAHKLSMRDHRASLTPRELETLECLVSGLSNKEIAAELNISAATVKLHLGHLFQKMEVVDRTQAVTAAIHRGIIHLD